MKKNASFQITFSDKTQFIGNLFKKDWGRIPDTKPIKEIVFSFGDKVVKMENYREYNLTYETHAIQGKGSMIDNISLVGRENNSSTVLEFNCRLRKLIKKEVNKYEELPWISNTWKLGVNEGNAKAYHE